MATAGYPSELTDEQWAVFRPLLPTSRVGHPRTRDLREVVDGILYVVKTGCPWRYVPKEYGHWSTCYYYFRQWREDGTWERAMGELRRRERMRLGRDPEPSALILDSQSARTTEKGGRAATTRARR
jgi:putative transposase